MNKKALLIFLAVLVIVILIILLFNITQGPGSQTAGTRLPYDFSKPEQQIILPPELTEISGISYFDKDIFACIEDETGIVQLFNYKTEKIIKHYEFRREADYEDIEIFETVRKKKKNIYVLRSNGKLYRINALDSETFKIRAYETPLTVKNNTEGLCYDKTTNSLLITCKGEQGLTDDGEDWQNKKVIYSFDLTKKEMLEKPFLVMDFKEIGNMFFQPSGLAVNPVTGNIYIISSTAKLLIVVDRKGNLINTQPLPRHIFIQPEGLCFSPGGALHISNEGKNGRANIISFAYKNAQ